MEGMTGDLSRGTWVAICHDGHEAGYPSQYEWFSQKFLGRALICRETLFSLWGSIAMAFALQPARISPMEAVRAEALPAGPGWQFEPKWDGFRCLAYRDGDRCV